MGRIQKEPQEFDLPDEVDVTNVVLETDTQGMPIVDVVDVVQRPTTTVGIGIDVGMTFSGASIYYRRPNGASYAVIPCGQGGGYQTAAKFESVIFEPMDGSQPSIGHQAVLRAGRNEPGKPYDLFKRYLGTPLDQQPPDDRKDAKRLTMQLLKYIKEQVEVYLRAQPGLERIHPVYRFTLPGMWPHKKVHAFNEAIRDAGFAEDSRGVVEEPVAMAVAASRLGLTPRLRSLHRRFVLVCDFGGGTFDVALISTDPSRKIATKAAPGGDADLGMSNLDKAIELLIFKKRAFITESEYQGVLGAGIIAGGQFEQLWSMARARVLKDPILLYKMHKFCEEMKQKICNQWDESASGMRGQRQIPAWSATLPSGEPIEFTRDEVAPLIAAMQNTAARALHKYLTKTLTNIPDLPDFDPRSINLALVGGGGALLPGIEQTLRDALPGSDVQVINVTQRAEEKTDSAGVQQHALGLVQLGAAMVAAEPSLVQERRAPASYGMAVRRFLSDELPKYDDYVSTLKTDRDDPSEQTYIAYERFFRQNATLPMKSVEIPVSPLRPGQRDYHIRIYTGEDENPFKNRYLGTVRGRLPDRASIRDEIKVVCFLGDDGEFHVEGRDWTDAVSPEVKLDLKDDSI